MIRRKLLIALAAAASCAALAALPMASASAEERTLLVTFVDGRQITVTVDAAPGTPAAEIPIPDATGPIASVQDVPPPPATTTATTTPTTTATTAPATTQTTPTTPTAPATTPTTPPALVPTTPSTPSTPSTPPTTPSTTPTTPTTPSTAPTTPTTPSTTTTTPGGDKAEDDGVPTAAHGDHKPQQLAQEITGDKKAPAKPEGSEDAGTRKRDRAKPADDAKAPTPANPTYTLALPGAAPIGVPNFFIDKFRIPPFLLSIYQAAGMEYGIRWEVLAAINEIETDYGRNLNVSTAGAVGWMQFLPSTWQQYGVDANDDGRKDPYNPVDAIFAAARYLRAAGAQTDLRRAIFAYNHADWYVDSVLLRARVLSGLPADFVGSLTGLTEGRFPVAAKATYADDLEPGKATARVAPGENAAVPVESLADRHSIDVYSKPGSPVIAVQDGRIVRMGTSKRLGNFIRLRDSYGNTYTYSHLKSLARLYPARKPAKESRAKIASELDLPHDPKPTAPASAGRQVREREHASGAATRRGHRAARANPPRKERLFANPSRPNAYRAGGRRQLSRTLTAGSLNRYVAGVYGLDRHDVTLERLRRGAKVIGGTILGHVGRTGDHTAPHLHFSIRPAGRGAPLIDPKPILDGWKLLESTAIYRAAGRNPFFGPDAKDPSIGQIMLMGKDALQRRVLHDPSVSLYSCGRSDIRAGVIDRRVLATLEFLSSSGLRPTVSSLRCGHSYLTTSGNVSEHSTGDAVDIAAVNGIPIVGHQGPGSITDITIRRLLTLQGAMKPHQIISLMTYPGTDNTLSLPDHYNHIHVGFRPLTSDKQARRFDSVLQPDQWNDLMDRLSHLSNPTVPLRPSPYALKVAGPGGSGAD